ncbi:MAG: YSC84-related protein [Candidatus Aadella gelida]|nr:YSC84-related protein [Candidatus Aadella gelida]
MRKVVLALVLVFAFTSQVHIGSAVAASAKVIDTQVEETLNMFEEVKEADSLIKSAKGLLVFPSVVKAGIGLGGEYGEGSLLVGGETEGYYNTASASIGFQLGIQKKSIIIAFMQQNALDKFLNSDGWKVGADASVAVIAVGAEGAIDTQSTNQPVVAFVFDQKGLMYNLTLEGTKITKLNK